MSLAFNVLTTRTSLRMATRTSVFDSRFNGLEWIQETFGIEPRWTFEPNVDGIKQILQSIYPSSAVDAPFLAQGAFNKVYDIRITADDVPLPLVMRVSLPVDPHRKTLSEVATLEWVSRNTSLPVPQVVAHEHRRENPVGFEWILMTKIPGKVLADSWRTLPLDAKSSLVRELAAHLASFFRNKLREVGNIYPDSTLPNVGRVVSMEFFWGGHVLQDVDRGPFRSARDWISARLALSEHDCRSTLAKYPDLTNLDSDGEDDVDDATRTLKIIKKLKLLLPRVLPTGDEGSEPTILFHDDLSRHNILVDDQGSLTGVLDWECVSALPLWMACSYPSFLEEKPRHTEPDAARYQRAEDGELADLYWEHLLQYETTLLRQEFMETMGRLEPEWVRVFEASEVQRDFEFAVRNCDDEFLARRINKWADELASGSTGLGSLQKEVSS